jgi:two-component system, OmpR family, sensor kinase
MNLRRKVIAASAAMLFTSTVGLGGLAIGITYQQGLSNVENELEQLVELIEQEEDPLSAALFEFDGLSVNVGYKLDDGSITMLQEAFVSSGPEDEISQALDLGYGESLIVSKSTKSIRNLVDQLLPIVLFSSLGFSLLSGLVLYGVLRRDVQGIRSLAKFARDTTAGEVSKIQNQRVSSEIQELAESMQVMVATLEQNQENMRDFLSDSSHELKTPLTVIRGYVEILQKEAQSPLEIERLDKVHAQALKMQNLVADLLMLAELESQSPLQPSTFSLGELVDQIIEGQKVLDPERGFESAVESSVKITADPALLERYLTNALSNIRIHTPSKTRARISHTLTASALVLIIEDSGTGLSSELLAKAGTRFHPEGKNGGTGLGLSIMKGIIQKLGGHLEFSQSPLGGLKLSAHIPQSQ